MYLTYAEYQTMGGTLDETTFNNFEFEAEALVNWYTFNRLKNDSTFPTELKRLVKYLIDLAVLQDSALATSGGAAGEGGTNAVVTSQSNDGVSIRYNVLGAHELMDALKEKSAGIVNRYLQGVMNEAGHKVLYRGVYPDE